MPEKVTPIINNIRLRNLTACDTITANAQRMSLSVSFLFACISLQIMQHVFCICIHM